MASTRAKKNYAERAARRYGINPIIFKRQIGAESNWDENASSGQAFDIAQFTPETARAYGVKLHDGNYKDDLMGAARYMHDNLKKYGGDYRKALSAYNSGRPDAYKDPSFAQGQTTNYVHKILGNQDPHGGATQDSVTPGRMTLQHGSTSLEVEDPELQRQQFFATWLQKKDPNNPLLRLGALDPMMSTTKTTKIPTVTGFKMTGGGGGGTSAAALGKGPQRAVAEASQRVGIGEVNGSNRGTRLDAWEKKYGMLGQPWCGIFVGLSLEKAGVKGINPRVASVAAIEEDARSGKNGFSRFLSPQHARAGDALIVRRGGHVGLVESVDKDGTIHTIEGNTSTGKVSRRTHSMGSVYGVARPRYHKR